LIVDVGNGVVYVAAVTMSQEQHRNLLHQMWLGCTTNHEDKRGECSSLVACEVHGYLSFDNSGKMSYDLPVCNNGMLI
jgi:hypothetical protein